LIRRYKAMKRYCFLIVNLLIVLTLAACSNDSGDISKHIEEMTKPPGISIKAGDKEITYVIGLNQWDGTIYDREDTFHTIMKNDASVKVPYIHLGETIQMEVEGAYPDKVELNNYILKENGDQKYTGKEVINIPINFTNGKGIFRLEKHMAAFLSSNIEDYEPGKTIRGFRLICSWGENECEYAYIIRTDAK
jgi:hypothetical protein